MKFHDYSEVLLKRQIWLGVCRSRGKRIFFICLLWKHSHDFLLIFRNLWGNVENYLGRVFFRHILIILKSEYANKTMLFTFSQGKFFPGTHNQSTCSDFFPYFTRGIGTIIRGILFLEWPEYVPKKTRP